MKAQLYLRYTAVRVVIMKILQTLYTTSDMHFLELILGAFVKLRKATINIFMSFCPTVCLSASDNSTPAGRILVKFDI